MANHDNLPDAPDKQVKNKGGIVHVWYACRYSLQGLSAAWRNEIAFRLELALACILLPCAFWLAQNAAQFFLLLGALFLVLMVELLNSAIEALADAISIKHNPLLGRAKDLSSAAVAFALIVAGSIWLSVIVNRFI